MDPHTVERPLSPMLTAAEASTILRVRVPQVYALARDGILPAVRVGRAVRFNREQLERRRAPKHDDRRPGRAAIGVN